MSTVTSQSPQPDSQSPTDRIWVPSNSRELIGEEPATWPDTDHKFRDFAIIAAVDATRKVENGVQIHTAINSAACQTTVAYGGYNGRRALQAIQALSAWLWKHSESGTCDTEEPSQFKFNQPLVEANPTED